MFYFWIFVFSTVGFMQTLRYGERRGGGVYGVVAVNYLIAVVGVAIPPLFRLNGTGLEASGDAIVIGLVAGTVYFGLLVTQLSAFKTSGVGIVSAANRCGIVVPVLFAWSLWGETMTVYRWLALAMLPPAMFLLRPEGGAGKFRTWKGEALIIICFLFSGVIATLFKFAEVNLGPAEEETCKVTLFGTAFVWTASAALIRRAPMSRNDVATGALLGMFNTLNLTSVLLALAVMPAVIFYPTSGCLIIVINVMLGRWLWKETFSRRQVLGLVLAVAIVILTNL